MKKKYSYSGTKRNGYSQGVEQGVFLNVKRKLWIVRIEKLNGGISTLGQYSTKEEAENVFNNSRLK
jgi:hypothetical protein